MGVAVSTGVAVAGGLLGMNEKQKEAKRQKELLAKQDAAQRMQADLQLFGLLQQRQVDSLSDMVTDAATKQSYLQTQASLNAQELQQQMAASQAKFGAEVQRMGADAESTQKQMAAVGERSNARLQAGSQAVEALAGATSEEQQLISSVLKQLQTSGSNQNSVSLLLDYAASAGGVNEALELLQRDDDSATEAQAEVNRASQVSQKKSDLSKAAANAGVNVADVQYMLANANAAIERQGSRFNAANAESDATASSIVNQAGIGAAMAANQANLGIMNSSNAIQRQSRYLNSLANEEALKQGTALNSEMLKAQQANVKSPGFFDYVNLGVQGYGMYNSLKKGGN